MAVKLLMYLLGSRRMMKLGWLQADRLMMRVIAFTDLNTVGARVLLLRLLFLVGVLVMKGVEVLRRWLRVVEVLVRCKQQLACRDLRCCDC